MIYPNPYPNKGPPFNPNPNRYLHPPPSRMGPARNLPLNPIERRGGGRSDLLRFFSRFQNTLPRALEGWGADGPKQVPGVGGAAASQWKPRRRDRTPCEPLPGLRGLEMIGFPGRRDPYENGCAMYLDSDEEFGTTPSPSS